jgi:hypothetical protein
LVQCLGCCKAQQWLALSVSFQRGREPGTRDVSGGPASRRLEVAQQTLPGGTCAPSLDVRPAGGKGVLLGVVGGLCISQASGGMLCQSPCLCFLHQSPKRKMAAQPALQAERTQLFYNWLHRGSMRLIYSNQCWVKSPNQELKKRLLPWKPC